MNRLDILLPPQALDAGGAVGQEVETLAESGFVPYTIGPRILRVETAVTALISRLY